MVRTLMALAVATVLAGAAAAADDAMITLSPHPGLSMQFPTGWKACDEANDKALGSADDTLALTAQICNPHKANPNFKFGAFAAVPGKTASVLLFHTATAPITAEAITALTDDVLKGLTEALKKERVEALAKVGGTVDDYQLRKDVLGGQPALVSLLLQTIKHGATTSQVYTETWEVPYAGSYFTINFIWPKLFESMAKPDVDKVKASVKFATPS